MYNYVDQGRVEDKIEKEGLKIGKVWQNRRKDDCVKSGRGREKTFDRKTEVRT